MTTPLLIDVYLPNELTPSLWSIHSILINQREVRTNNQDNENSFIDNGRLAIAYQFR